MKCFFSVFKKFMWPMVLVSSLCVACAMAPDRARPDARHYTITASYAFPQSENTSLGRSIVKAVAAHKGQSGFHILESGLDSMVARIGLLRAAEKSVDLQYYTVHDDLTSNLFLEAILRAAQRGVRIRFLIDGISLKEVGKSMAVLDGNKNIEIRVFNPVATPGPKFLMWLKRVTTDLGHASRRMHNKAMIVDNQVSVIGGRNLGDEYFDAAKDIDFKDVDVLAAGPITARVSHSFDRYWNGKDSYPIAALYKYKANPDELAKLKEELRAEWDKHAATKEGRRVLLDNFSDALHRGDIKLSWANAELAADEPEKINQATEVENSKPYNRLLRLLEDAKHDFIMTSPYFVPQEDGVQLLGQLVKRGVRTRILTNSLASTDVVLAHTGYKPYRVALLRDGVELYEAKPTGGKKPQQRFLATTAPAHASIHTKTYVVDGHHVIIGSFNFDPRSIDHNTEIALVIHSEEIGRKITDMFNGSITEENAYRVKLLGKSGIAWETRDPDGKRVYHTEPKAGFWRRTQSFFYGFLPVEDYL